MANKRNFSFFKDDAEQTPIEVIEDRSFKRAIIEYITKRGKQLREYVSLPIGRFKKLGKEMYNR